MFTLRSTVFTLLVLATIVCPASASDTPPTEDRAPESALAMGLDLFGRLLHSQTLPESSKKALFKSLMSFKREHIDLVNEILKIAPSLEGARPDTLILLASLCSEEQANGKATRLKDLLKELRQNNWTALELESVVACVLIDLFDEDGTFATQIVKVGQDNMWDAATYQNVLSGLRHIPINRRQDILKNAFTMIEACKLQPDEMRYIPGIIESHSLDEAEKLVRRASKVLALINPDGEARVKLLHEFSFLMEEMQIEAFEELAPVIKATGWHAEYWEPIKNYTEITPEARQVIPGIVSILVDRKVNGPMAATALMTLGFHPADNRAAILDRAMSFVAEHELPTVSYEYVMGCLPETEPSSQQTMLRVISSVLESTDHENIQTLILSNLTSIPLNQQLDALKTANEIRDALGGTEYALAYTAALAGLDSKDYGVAKEMILKVHALPGAKENMVGYMNVMVHMIPATGKTGYLILANMLRLLGDQHVTAQEFLLLVNWIAHNIDPFDAQTVQEVQQLCKGRRLTVRLLETILVAKRTQGLEHLQAMMTATDSYMDEVDLLRYPNFFEDILMLLLTIHPDNFQAALKSSAKLSKGKGWNKEVHEALLHTFGVSAAQNHNFIIEAFTELMSEQKQGNSTGGVWCTPDIIHFVFGLSQLTPDRFKTVRSAYHQLTEQIGTSQNFEQAAMFFALCQGSSLCDLDAVVEALKMDIRKPGMHQAALNFLAALYTCTSPQSWPMNRPSAGHLLARVSSGQMLGNIMSVLPLIPEELMSGYFITIANFMLPGDESVNRHNMPLALAVNHLAACCEAAETFKAMIIDRLYHHLISPDRHISHYVAGFVEDYWATLGLDEDGQLVQTARDSIIRDSKGNALSPHTLYSQLLERRKAEINWWELPVIGGQIGGCIMRLNPKRVHEFALSFTVDVRSVPKLDASHWCQLVDRLYKRLTSQQDAKDPFMEDAVTVYRSNIKLPPETASMTEPELVTMLKKNLLGLADEARRPSEYFCRLMNSGQNSYDGAQMKCITQSFLNKPVGDDTNLDLCKFICGIRGCIIGQGSALQDAYLDLNPEFKLRTLATNTGILFRREELRAMEALQMALETCLSSIVTPGHRFMKAVCNMPQAQVAEGFSHEQIWVKNLCGYALGFRTPPKFDPMGDRVPAKIREKSLQELVNLFYLYVQLPELTQRMCTTFDRYLQSDKPEQRSIYRSVQDIFESWKNKPENEVFVCYEDQQIPSWLVTRFKDDEDYIGQTHITELGMVRLMSKVILDPWGE